MTINKDEELIKGLLNKARSAIEWTAEYRHIVELCTCKPSVACMYQCCLTAAQKVISNNKLRKRLEAGGDVTTELAKYGIQYLYDNCYTEIYYRDEFERRNKNDAS